MTSNRSLRIFHISSCNFHGGAARAGFRQHLALIENGHDSYWLDSQREDANHNVIRVKQKKTYRDIPKRLRVKLQRMLAGVLGRKIEDYWSLPVSNMQREWFSGLQKPDVWNIHWAANFLDWKTQLPWMAKLAPIVWTLHDENPYRGIFHYQPKKVENRSITILDDFVTRHKVTVTKSLPRSSLTMVGPSRWICEQFKSSAHSAHLQVTNIPYGVDTSTFQPFDKTSCRFLFGIQDNIKVIGFVADSLLDKRKGVSDLLKAIDMLENRSNMVLLTVGNGEIRELSIPHVHLGPVMNDRLLAMFYSAIDVFVCPSLQDNLPNTILESISCGTPIVGTKVGGIPDVIDRNGCGCLADAGDPVDLAKKIEIILNTDLSALSSRCRLTAEREYSFAACSNRYEELYNQLIQERN